MLAVFREKRQLKLNRLFYYFHEADNEKGQCEEDTCKKLSIILKQTLPYWNNLTFFETPFKDKFHLSYNDLMNLSACCLKLTELRLTFIKLSTESFGALKHFVNLKRIALLPIVDSELSFGIPYNEPIFVSLTDAIQAWSVLETLAITLRWNCRQTKRLLDTVPSYVSGLMLFCLPLNDTNEFISLMNTFLQTRTNMKIFGACLPVLTIYDNLGPNIEELRVPVSYSSVIPNFKKFKQLKKLTLFNSHGNVMPENGKFLQSLTTAFNLQQLTLEMPLKWHLDQSISLVDIGNLTSTKCCLSELNLISNKDNLDIGFLDLLLLSLFPTLTKLSFSGKIQLLLEHVETVGKRCKNLTTFSMAGNLTRKHTTYDVDLMKTLVSHLFSSTELRPFDKPLVVNVFWSETMEKQCMTAYSVLNLNFPVSIVNLAKYW